MEADHASGPDRLIAVADPAGSPSSPQPRRSAWLRVVPWLVVATLAVLAAERAIAGLRREEYDITLVAWLLALPAVTFLCWRLRSRRTMAVAVAVGSIASLAVVTAQVEPCDRRGSVVSLAGCDLRGADLQGVVLDRADLTGADLSGADLRGADLTGAVLDEAVLVGADLGSANLSMAQIGGANLEGAELAEADLRGAALGGARLVGARLVRVKGAEANFPSADLTGADLSEADLARADLTGAKLGGAKFAGAAFTGADFTRATFDAPDFSGVDLTSARFDSVQMPGATMTGARASGASLTRATLTGLRATDVDLSSAFLGGAMLDGAVLIRAKLPFAQLGNASLVDANLEGAELRAANLVRAKLGGARLVGANLRDADASEADLQGALLDGVVAEGAQFDRANLNRIAFTDGSWARADLTASSLAAAHLQNVHLDGTVLTGAQGVSDEMLASALGVARDALARTSRDRKLVFEPRSEIVERLGRACKGEPVEGPRPYEPNADFHGVVVFSGNGTITTGTNGSRGVHDAVREAGWEPTALRFADLVACLDDPSTVSLEVCRYTLFGGGPALPITRYRVDRRVRVVAAATGEVAYQRTFSGATPGACPQTAPASQTEVRGSTPSTEGVKDWLGGFVQASV